MNFLEFQDEMYTDVVHHDACLLIASRGIGLEQLMIRLCRTYSDDTSLVIVIGTEPDDELFFINQILDEKNVPYGKLPQRITSESSNTKKRRDLYLQGGVLFVTERILVVDLLCDRVPLDLVTGLIIYRAHKIYSNCSMAFILRLYRMKNKKGFIKALSQNAQAFFGDYGKLDRIMRSLFVTELYLWPRFHASIQASFAKSKFKPEVTEINLPMSQTMKNIQFDIMDLIGMCLKELIKTNTSFLIDSEQLNVENAINRSFDGFIKRKFDEIWHQLGLRAKRLIHDIQWLRNLLNLLTQSDAVTFYNQTRAARNSIRFGCEVSDWIFWKPADRLFKLARERIYPDNNEVLDLDAETNLKWKAFQDLIDEIDRNTSHLKETVDVIVIVANDGVARLLQAILKKGAVNVLKERFERFNAFMRANQGSSDAIRLFGLQDESVNSDDQHVDEPPVKKRFRLRNPAADVRQPESAPITLTQLIRRKTNDEGKVTLVDIEEEEEEERGQEEIKKSEGDKSTPENLRAEQTFKVHALRLHYFSSRDKHIILESQLYDYKPRHIIMYDLDVHAVRQVEIYQASHCFPDKCQVYTIQFEKSYDLQLFLTSLRREKEAFENLIKEKTTMVIPSGRDGKTEGHPDLIRGGKRANDTTNSRCESDGSVCRKDVIQQKVLVDVREFRCELPSIIHMRGIEVEPIQLEIGDYILSSDTCVERKSVSDLIQSLQSGRLYNQAAMMIRHFKRSILLIEFDENKSFHFKGRYWGLQATSSGYVGSGKKDYLIDLIDRLILLTIHHPSLKIVWSPSTNFTAELFEYLKTDRDQPDAEQISTISSEELPPETFEDKYDLRVKEFLLKLPGVNSRNVFNIMNRVQTLAELSELSEEELQELLQNSRSAELLYRTLNCSLGKIAKDAILAQQDKKKSGLFSCTKKRKGL